MDETTNRITQELGKRKKYILPLLFVGIVVFLGIFVSKLGLLLDDNVHIFPALLHDYFQHFKGYTHDYGLMRPLGLILFYVVYPLFLFSPMLSHLLIFAFQLWGAYLVLRIGEKTIGKTDGVFLSILYLVFPLFTEQYGWLAASNATVANLILIAELHFVIRRELSFGLRLFLLILFQALAVMFYESTFFTFIPLIILLIRIKPKAPSVPMTALYLFLASLPSLLYIAVRDFIFPPHHGFALRELTLTEVLNGTWIQIIFQNMLKLLDSMRFLFHPHVFEIFWIPNFVLGIHNLTNPFLLISFLWIILFGTILVFSFKQTRMQPKFVEHASLWLCFSLAFFSFLPSMLLQAPTFPFRVLALPAYFFLVGVLLLIRHYSNRVFLAAILLSCLYGLISSSFILQSMGLQSQKDEEAFTTIMQTIDPKIPAGKTTTLIIKNAPHSNLTSLTYGEYLGTCISNDWCLQAAMNRRTNKVTNVLVNPSKNSVPSKNTSIFTYDPAKDGLVSSKK